MRSNWSKIVLNLRVIVVFAVVNEIYLFDKCLAELNRTTNINNNTNTDGDRDGEDQRETGVFQVFNANNHENKVKFMREMNESNSTNVLYVGRLRNLNSSLDNVYANRTRSSTYRYNWHDVNRYHHYSNETNSGHNRRQYNWYVLSLSLFSIFGMFGNILVCKTIQRDPALQTKTNYYLFSLAMADLAVCLIVLPLSIIQDFTDRWIFSTFLCTFWIFSDILLCTSSIYHLSAVSILRFIAIQYPLKSNRTISTNLTFFILFLIWSVSIMFSSIILFLGYYDPNNILDTSTHRCILKNENFILYGSIFSFVIPLCIMIVMFSLMTRKLKMQLAKLDNSSSSVSPNESTKRKFKTTNNVNPNNYSNQQNGLKYQKPSIVIQFNNNNINNNKTKLNSYDDGNPTNGNVKLKTLTIENGAAECVTGDNLNNNNNNSNNNSNSLLNSKNYKSDNLGDMQIRRHPAVKRSFVLKSESFVSNHSLQVRPRVAKNLYTFDSPSLRRSTMFKNRNTEYKNSFLGHLSRLKVQSEVKALRVLGIVFISFIIAWMPFCLLNILSALLGIYKSSIYQFHNIINYLTYLGYFQSTFNPIIYTVFNQKFRRNFLEILKCTNTTKSKKYRRRI